MTSFSGPVKRVLTTAAFDAGVAVVVTTDDPKRVIQIRAGRTDLVRHAAKSVDIAIERQN